MSLIVLCVSFLNLAEIFHPIFRVHQFDIHPWLVLCGLIFQRQAGFRRHGGFFIDDLHAARDAFGAQPVRERLDPGGALGPDQHQLAEVGKTRGSAALRELRGQPQRDAAVAAELDGRQEILGLIMDIFSKKDIQVLISSHILMDIEATCSYVVILNKGQLAAEGKISDLKQIEYRLFELKVKGETEKFFKKLTDRDCRVDEMEDGMFKVYMPPRMNPQDIFRFGAEVNTQIRHFVKSQTSLEDLFAEVVGVD